jgi:hypothetical protein
MVIVRMQVGGGKQQFLEETTDSRERLFRLVVAFGAVSSTHD